MAVERSLDRGIVLAAPIFLPRRIRSTQGSDPLSVIRLTAGP